MSDTTDLIADRLAMVVNECLDDGEDADYIVAKVMDEMRRGVGGNSPPSDDEPPPAVVDPTDLLRVALTDIFPLLDGQYPDVAARNAEIIAAGQRIQAAHENGRKPLAGDADYLETVEWLRVADEHLKELTETAEPVTQPLFQAHRKALEWFKALRDGVEAIRGTGRNPSLGTLQQMHTAWLAERDRLARAEQRRIAEEAEAALAVAKAIAARRQAEEDAAGQHASEEAMRATDAAVAAAEAAQVAAEIAARASAAPAGAFAKTRDALGTSSLVTTWDFKPSSKPLMLYLAIGAPMLADLDVQKEVAVRATIGLAGVQAVLAALAHMLTPEGVPIPQSFVSMEEGAIRKAIGRKQMPMRRIPGLEIIEGSAARRRGT